MVDIVGLTECIFLYGPQPYPVNSIDHTDTNDVKKRKRTWNRYTPAQTYLLEGYFLQSQRLDANRKKEIAEKTGLERFQVRCWFENRQRRERRAQSRLASNQQASEAPGNHTVTMGLSEFSTPEAPSGIASTSGASHSTLPITSPPSAEHDYGLQENPFSGEWLSGDLSAALEPQYHTQSQSSGHKLDEAKLSYSYKSFTPPPSYTNTDPFLEVGVEQTTTLNHTVEIPQNSAVHCGLCDRAFSRPQDLKRHQKTDRAHREGTQVEIWECLYCGDQFQSKRSDAWKRHMAEKHRAEVCLLKVLPDGTMVEWKRKKTQLAIGSKPSFEHDREYNGRYFRVKQY